MSAPEPVEPLPFIDLQAQRRALGDRIEVALRQVLEHGRFVLGPEVHRLEEVLREMGGAGAAVTCANGTDALLLALMLEGLEPGEAVILPSFTFAATAEAVVLRGGVPVFADVSPDDFNMSAEQAAAALQIARERGLRAAGIIAVDLFGVPADYDALSGLAAERGLWLVADAAQSVGASRGGRPVGSLAPVTTASFYPAKPLGAYGDAGAVLVMDPDRAALLRSLRVHGEGADKYDNVHIGRNSRLDTLQAAVLLAKLETFANELAARDRIAARYSEHLAGVVTVPRVPGDATSSWAQYTVRLPDGADRDRVRESLRARGVPSAVYYGKPLHRQTAYEQFPAAEAPGAEHLAAHVLSLPMHGYLEEAQQDRVIAALRAELD